MFLKHKNICIKGEQEIVWLVLVLLTIRSCGHLGIRSTFRYHVTSRVVETEVEWSGCEASRDDFVPEMIYTPQTSQLSQD